MPLLFCTIVAVAVAVVAIEELISAGPRRRRRRLLRSRPLLSADEWCPAYLVDCNTPAWIAWEVAQCFAWAWKCDPGQIRATDPICLPPEQVFRILPVDKFDGDLDFIDHLLQLFVGEKVHERIPYDKISTIGDLIASLHPHADEIEKHLEAWKTELRRLKPHTHSFASIAA
jgi:hypothetical protein